jgi:hypothetical protein
MKQNYYVKHPEIFLENSEIKLTQVAKNHLSFATAFFSYF